MFRYRRRRRGFSGRRGRRRFGRRGFRRLRIGHRM